MGDSSGQMHGILAITQKLNFIENIYKKLNNFEMDGHLHKFLPELSLLSRRGLLSYSKIPSLGDGQTRGKSAT